MDIKKALIDGINEVLYQFGINPLYVGETEDEKLSSAQPVNILIGLSVGMRGNIVLGLNQVTALKIVSSMMGGTPVNTLDDIAKSALAEFTNMVLGSATAKLNSTIKVDYSPPTVVVGKKLYLMISRLKSYKLTFELDDYLYDLSFCIE
jgi:chemotaxis protein CheX